MKLLHAKSTTRDETTINTCAMFNSTKNLNRMKTKPTAQALWNRFRHSGLGRPSPMPETSGKPGFHPTRALWNRLVPSGLGRPSPERLSRVKKMFFRPARALWNGLAGTGY